MNNIVYPKRLITYLYFVSYPYALQKEMFGRILCPSVTFSFSLLNGERVFLSVISFCVPNIYICLMNW